MALLLPLLLCLTALPQDERRAVAIPQADDTPAEASAKIELRRYDVAVVTGFDRIPPLRESITPATHPFSVERARTQVEQLEAELITVGSTTEGLLELLRERMQPPFVPGAQSLHNLQDGWIAFFGLESQHRWVSDFLSGTERFNGLIELRARILTLSPETYSGLDLPEHGQILGADEGADLLARIRSTDAQLVQAPRVIVQPFRKATLSITRQVAYVRDYELKVFAAEDLEIADPIVDVVESGIVMDLRGLSLEGGKLGIHALVNYTALEEPIPSVQLHVGSSDHTVTIQRPVVRTIHVEGHFDIHPEETLALVSSDPETGERVVVLLRAALTGQ